MATYQIPNVYHTITDPVIESINPSFQIGLETVSIVIVLKEANNERQYILIEQMANTDEWSDADVEAFAQERLEAYLVLYERDNRD